MATDEYRRQDQDVYRREAEALVDQLTTCLRTAVSEYMPDQNIDLAALEFRQMALPRIERFGARQRVRVKRKMRKELADGADRANLAVEQRCVGKAPPSLFS